MAAAVPGEQHPQAGAPRERLLEVPLQVRSAKIQIRWALCRVGAGAADSK